MKDTAIFFLFLVLGGVIAHCLNILRGKTDGFSLKFFFYDNETRIITTMIIFVSLTIIRYFLSETDLAQLDTLLQFVQIGSLKNGAVVVGFSIASIAIISMNSITSKLLEKPKERIVERVKNGINGKEDKK